VTLAPDTVDIAIERIGARGDGVADVGGRRVFVPLGVPGDRLRVRLGRPRGEGVEAEIVERLADGSDRAAPPCRHFGDCGGCQLQHLSGEAYRRWKRAVVVEALAQRGVAAEVEPLLALSAATRRRAKFVAERRGGPIQFGFNARRSRRAVDVGTCLVLAPTLARLLPTIRAALPAIVAEGQRIELQVTALPRGADLLAIGGGALGAARRDALKALAATADMARIAWRASEGAETEIVVERRAVVADFDGVGVELPPGAFLQASAEGEAAMRAFVLEACGRAARVADLFAGCGSFAAPLARKARVKAVEGDPAACAALEDAARERADLRLKVERRDLERRPLLPSELEAFDAVIFDPPRGGAGAQAKQLARLGVPTVVALSCNPATFARDARMLLDGGYRLERVRPIDQFVFSAHVEVAAVFRAGRPGV